jgi:cellulose synthase/poly-beta-1,6-N-acetylglucosamine synthase-like glycosyltransferase
MSLWQIASGLTLAGELALLAPVGYLAVVALAASWPARRMGRAGASDEPLTRFAIIVPAHDEQDVIGSLLTTIGQLTYPRDAYAVYVIADNCTDDTAGVVERSGVARALVRRDSERRGKGQALAWAFAQLDSHEPAYDAYIVIDADAVVAPDALAAYHRAMRTGAAAAQSSNTVLNTLDSPATVLRWLALTLMNHVRPLGRNRLGATSTITGNGMCLSRALLQRVPWTAFGLSEDYQYYLTITLAGERTIYAPDAIVQSVMPTTFAEMRTQDLRWESQGQGPSTRAWAARFFAAGLRGRDWRRLEAIAELLTPPLSQLLAGVTVVAVAALLLWWWPLLALAGLLLAGMLCYIGSAFWLLRPPAATYRSLLAAPGFVVWKLWVTLVARRKHSRQGAWVRTSRAPIARP